MTQFTISRILTGLLLTGLTVPALAFSMSEPCVPDGGSTDPEFKRPDLPVPDAEWTGNATGDPQASDSDVGPDQDMGPADSGSDPTTASVQISNSGGDLSGPNGDTVNGGLDGSCAEVYLTWSYRVKHTISFTLGQTIDYEPGGVGGTTSGSVTFTYSWFTYHTIDSAEKEVCPC